MDRRTWIDSGIWKDKAFRSSTALEKLAYLYVLTSPESNMAGFYRLPLDYIEVNLGKKAKDVLVKPSKLYKYDPESEQIFIPNYLKYNTAKSPQQLKGLAMGIRGLEYSPLFKDFAFELQRWCGDKAFEYLNEEAKRYLTYLKEIEENELDKARLEILISNIVT